MENLSSKIDSISQLIEQEKSIPIIYIAGAYRGDGQRSTHYDNIEKAESTAFHLSTLGFGYFCPHSNGALSTFVSRQMNDVEGYNQFQTIERHELNMSICRRLLMACDAVLMIDGWKNSPGAKEEHDLALTLGIPVFYLLDDLKASFEPYFAYPKQFNMLRGLQCIAYQLHREKNLDYSPYNIKATGSVGLVTRLWDKLARIMKLTGFNIGTGIYNKPILPKNEAITDTFVDLANYAMFYPILDKKMWGK